MLNPSQVGVYTDIGSRVVILWTGDLKNKKVMGRGLSSVLEAKGFPVGTSAHRTRKAVAND